MAVWRQNLVPSHSVILCHRLRCVLPFLSLSRRASRLLAESGMVEIRICDILSRLGLRHSSSLKLSLLSLLTNTLPGPNASEVTTLRRYTNLFIIIIIIIPTL